MEAEAEAERTRRQALESIAKRMGVTPEEARHWLDEQRRQIEAERSADAARSGTIARFKHVEKKLGLWFWICSLAVGFYTTFVAQSLWNWFVVTALNVPQLGYWQMYGLVLLLRLLFAREENPLSEKRWEIAFDVLEMCVPKEMGERLGETSDEHEEDMWRTVKLLPWARILENTVVLCIGWFVHVLI